jgi:hypothetical protein
MKFQQGQMFHDIQDGQYVILDSDADSLGIHLVRTMLRSGRVRTSVLREEDIERYLSIPYWEEVTEISKKAELLLLGL